MIVPFRSVWAGARVAVWAVSLFWVFFPQALAAAAAPETLFEWRPFLGPFHSIVVHFPIGFVTMAFLVDLYALWRRKIEVQAVITLMLGLSIAATVVTIVLGLLRATGGEYDPQTLSAHRNFGIGVGVLTVGTFLVQWLGYRNAGSGSRRPVLRGAYRVLLVGNIFLMGIAGHEGGNLTHGSNYLTKNAPAFVRTLVAGDSASDLTAVAAGSEQETFFLEKVKPVFDAKCLSCHGPEKQKSKYRVDQPDSVLKGGDSEKPAVVPGDPAASNLVRLILLPPDHDDLMPPAGKSALSAEEIMQIIRWIQQGAHLPGGAAAGSTNGP